MQVLYVEDDATAARNVGRLIRRVGGTMVVAETGAQAMTLLEVPWRLILCDFMLPDQDGVEIIQQIRSQRPDVPIIMLTGCGMDGEEEACRSAGCDDYLIKPIEPDELELLLRKYLT